MIITKIEKIIIPQTLDGQKFADEYEKIYREMDVFSKRTEDTEAIVIKAQSYYEILVEAEVRLIEGDKRSLF